MLMFLETNLSFKTDSCDRDVVAVVIETSASTPTLAKSMIHDSSVTTSSQPEHHCKCRVCALRGEAREIDDCTEGRFWI